MSPRARLLVQNGALLGGPERALLAEIAPKARTQARRAGSEHCPEAGAIDDRTKALSDDFRTRLKTELAALARSVMGPALAPKEDPQ
jgi:hypothetical protein